MALLATVYCSEDDIVDRIGTNMRDQYADVNRTGTADQDVIDEAINRATLEVDLYLKEKHTAVQLSGSDMVKRWCTTMAIRFLTTAAGNSAPAAIEEEYQKIADPVIGLLVRVKNGDLSVPDIALRSDMRPTMSNLTVDRRYRRSTVRRTPQNSTGSTSVLGHDDTFENASVWD